MYTAYCVILHSMQISKKISSQKAHNVPDYVFVVVHFLEEHDLAKRSLRGFGGNIVSVRLCFDASRRA